jgi:hypothetical protein
MFFHLFLLLSKKLNFFLREKKQWAKCYKNLYSMLWRDKLERSSLAKISTLVYALWLRLRAYITE